MDQSDAEKIIIKSANKYRNKEIKDDLIQEGWVAYFEAKGKGIEDHSKITTKIRKAMYNYVNFRNLAVTVPVTGDTYKTKKVVTEENLGLQTKQVTNLFYAIQNNTVSYGSTPETDYVEDTTFELKNLLEYELTQEELLILNLKVYEEKTFKEISLTLNISPQSVYNKYNRAVKKLKEVLQK